MGWFKYLKDRIQGKAKKGQKRSSRWKYVRKTHLRSHDCCAVCGSRKKLEVHHKIPFHVAPDLELDPNNLITLCENGRFKGINCHLAVGHLCDYREANPNVEIDAMTWAMKLRR